jgi:hypothetical protein
MMTNRGLETQMRLESLVLFFNSSHRTAPTTSTTVGGARRRDLTYGAGDAGPQYVFFFCFFIITLLNDFYY